MSEQWEPYSLDHPVTLDQLCTALAQIPGMKAVRAEVSGDQRTVVIYYTGAREDHILEMLKLNLHWIYEYRIIRIGDDNIE